MNLPPAVFVHPTALVETGAVGDGTRIWAFAHVMAGASIGRGCNIGDHAFVESGAVVGDRVTVKNHALIWDGVTIDDDVFIGPNVVFTNDPAPRVRYKHRLDGWVETRVRAGASIGANATIVCGIEIGRNAMIGAGSVVTRDVPDHALFYGNPARFAGWVCECGERLNPDLACTCGLRYRLVDGVLCE
jgi:UDP-2-acetamido-3-amino-2,3-dideoxy-glucuronate N-acetyltransferase